MSTEATAFTPQFCDPATVSALTAIHYGSTQYDHARVHQVRNNIWVKPVGGLWVSPVDSEWGWKQWCEAENFRPCDEQNSFRLKFYPDAKIIRIDNFADLMELPSTDGDILPGFKMFSIDFELLAKTRCDAVWLTEKGQKETRYSQPVNLYGWDCESILIINPECCYQI